MLQLTEMNSAEFDAYLAYGIQDYADMNVQAGIWSQDEALEKSRRAHQELLPSGMHTPDHYFYRIHDPLGSQEIARRSGLDSIGLTVFASNRVARELYESLGYLTLSLYMRKKLA
jgi:hypothetical protein